MSIFLFYTKYKDVLTSTIIHMNYLLLIGLIILNFSSSLNAYFPVGRCYVHQCAASPYIFEWISTSNPACFRVNIKDCIDNSQYNCCTVLTNTVQKLTLPVNPVCGKTALSYVTLNGVRKTGGVYYDDYGAFAELRFTALYMNANSFNNSLFCLYLTNPCPNITDYCKESDGICKFAMFNPDLHTCCPTCLFNLCF